MENPDLIAAIALTVILLGLIFLWFNPKFISAIAIPKSLSEDKALKSSNDFIIYTPLVKEIQSEAKIYLGAFNRAQQDFYLESQKFANSAEFLNLEISMETENYSYSIVQLDYEAVQIIGKAKKPEAKSYLGLTWIGKSNEERISFSVMFESIEPTQETPIIQVVNNSVVCPVGYIKN